MDETAFAFLRPLWLWGYVPLALGALWWWRRLRGAASAWLRAVDAELVPYVMENDAARRARGTGLLFTGWALALLALSGPVWERQPVPLFEASGAQVIAFDLSRSMLADDVAPDRLTRARYKLSDLMARAGGIRTGLVAFAERPYVISPLTDDAATLEAFLPSLAPSIMPAQGSRPDLALEQSLALLERAGAARARVILITDGGVDDDTLAAAERLRRAGHTLSVLGVGTSAGAPLRNADGRFVRRADGRIVVPRLDVDALGRLASAGGGVAVTMSDDARDLDALVRERPAVRESGDGREPVGRERWWIERSPWLLPPLALLALGLFRRGVIV